MNGEGIRIIENQNNEARIEGADGITLLQLLDSPQFLNLNRLKINIEDLVSPIIESEAHTLTMKDGDHFDTIVLDVGSRLTTLNRICPTEGILIIANPKSLIRVI